MHMDEIHSKLVDIMHDRLQMAVKQLAAESQSWGATAPATAATAATTAPLAAGAGAAGAAAGQEVVGDAVRGLVRSLGTLRSVLAPILQKEEVRAVLVGAGEEEEGCEQRDWRISGTDT